MYVLYHKFVALIFGNCIYNIIRFLYNPLYVFLCTLKYCSKKGSIAFQRVYVIKNSPESLLYVSSSVSPSIISFIFLLSLLLFYLHFPSFCPLFSLSLPSCLFLFILNMKILSRVLCCSDK